MNDRKWYESKEDYEARKEGETSGFIIVFIIIAIIALILLGVIILWSFIASVYFYITSIKIKKELKYFYEKYIFDL